MCEALSNFEVWARASRWSMVKVHVRGLKVETPGSSFPTMDRKFHFGPSDRGSRSILHAESDFVIHSERFWIYKIVFLEILIFNGSLRHRVRFSKN